MIGGYTKEAALSDLGSLRSEWNMESTDPVFRRGGDWSNSKDITLSNPILADATGCSVRLDGETIADPTTATFSGGWQIVSIKADAATAVRGLGVNGAAGSTSGGQNYAEIMLFENELTDEQREVVEAYLSAKWGIILPGVVGTEAGGSTTIAGGEVNVVGYGDLSVKGDAVLHGMLGGGLRIASGATVTIADESLAYTVDELPSDGLAARFDPSEENNIVLDSTDGITINGLYDCGSSHASTETWKLYAYYSESAAVDRRPMIDKIAKAFGKVMPWMDFNTPSDATGAKAKGKDLRTTKFSGNISNHNGSNDAMTILSAFIVSDSSQGGGSLLLGDPASATEMKALKPREGDGADYSKPIWNSTYATVKNGATYLNGIHVGNGTESGLSGGPEVVSAVFSEETNLAIVKALGYFGGSTYNKSHAILGEIILYSTALEDDVRAGIEAYLMKKWLGKLPAGFTDLRDATLSGDGTVSVAKLAALPKIGDGFTGSVKFTGDALAFTFDATERTITDPVTVAAPLTATASGGVVTVSGDALKTGIYTLVSADGSVSGFSGWTVSAQGAVRASLVVDGAALKLRVDNGLRVIIR